MIGLNEADLAYLDCDLVRNPHYRSFAPMSLYNRADVEATSKAKLAGKRAERILREVNFKIRKEEKKEAALAAIERVKELELAPLWIECTLSAHKILARCTLVQGKNVRDTRSKACFK